jgi:hypothetical protein
MADVAAAAFGRRVSTTDYVSLVGRTSIPGPSPGGDETQPLVAKDMRATGVLAELQTLLALALPVVCTVPRCGPCASPASSMEHRAPFVNRPPLCRLGRSRSS